MLNFFLYIFGRFNRILQLFHFKRITVFLNKKRQNIIFKKLLPYFEKSYNENLKTNYNDNSNNVNKYIWIFWWQGKDNMPLVVRRCVKSVIKNSSDYKVILITKNNINKFTNIPIFIQKKLKNNEITLTHFSDILRFNLLKNYGGLWIDATVYVTSKISLNNNLGLYTSGGYSNPYLRYVSSKWTAFLIGGNKNNVLFTFMDDFFKNYWCSNNKLVDYFMVDFALYYAYEQNIGNFKKYVDNIAIYNNPHLHFLEQLMNQKYNDELYRSITKDTNIFKLTYKKKFKSNGDTFYERLIKNKFPFNHY